MFFPNIRVFFLMLYRRLQVPCFTVEIITTQSSVLSGPVCHNFPSFRTDHLHKKNVRGFFCVSVHMSLIAGAKFNITRTSTIIAQGILHLCVTW